MPPTPWTEPTDIEAVWRSLTTDETTRARGLIGVVERAILRRWPDTQRRIDSEELNVDDVKDVVVWVVLPLLGVPAADVPMNAKSYQITSGSESRSVTLAAPGTDTFLTFTDWMVDVFDPAADDPSAGALPLVDAPESGRWEGLGWVWGEERRHGLPR
ncbi:Gp19/Gp15/Gp42 family protein [Microbacterium sp. M1A1_1b]